MVLKRSAIPDSSVTIILPHQRERKGATELSDPGTQTAAYWIESVTRQLDAARLSFGHGTDNPRDEALWLVLAALGESLDGTFSDWQRIFSREQQQDLVEMLRRRISDRTPVAYITGVARFAGLEFEVNEDVLVPRSPIAELIEDQFVPWVRPGMPQSVLDLCTGSGCIAIACAAHIPRVHVDAVDLSAGAVDVAGRNVLRHGLEERVTVIESDLFHSLEGHQYDLIVSNPPYVPGPSVSSLPAEFRAEPELGLASGHDGLDVTLRILHQAAEFLTDEGILICEVGESAQRLEALLPAAPFTWIEFFRGGAGVFLLGWRQLTDIRASVTQALQARKTGEHYVP